MDRLPVLLLGLLLPACFPKAVVDEDGSDSGGLVLDGDTDGDGDTDTDTDTDGDGDTDYDTDDDTDTDTDTDSEPPDHSGAWVGTFEVTMSEEYLGNTDTCVGDFSLQVDAPGDSELLGAGLCEWVGGFGFLTGPGELALSATLAAEAGRLDDGVVLWRSVDTDNYALAAGSMDASGGAMGATFSGAGTVRYLGFDVPVQFSGRVDVQR